MQDKREPFSYIKDLAVQIFCLSSTPLTPARLSPVRRLNSSRYIYSIDEAQEYESEEPCPSFNPNLVTSDLNTHILEQMARDSQIHYDYYKCLYINLSYVVGKKEKNLLKFLNKKLQEKAYDSTCDRVLRAFSVWQQEALASYNYFNSPDGLGTERDQRFLVVQSYLYHIALEKVFFEYLGLVDDPILKKLFSQGLVIYALADLYFRDEPQVMGYLNSVGVPLALRFDNSLLNLNQGKDWSYSRPLRNWTTDYNLYRLTVTRIRRLWLTLNDLHGFHDLTLWMMVVDPLVQMTMRFLNLVYFMPRLTTQFLCIFKHLFMTSWMTEQEKQMHFSQRLAIQFNRRWEVCFRDSLWCFNSLLNFFVLTGVHASWSLWLNAGLQLIETCLNIYFYFEFLDQKKIRTLLLHNLEPEALLQINLMDQLEEKNRYIRMINSLLILLSNILVLHVFFVVSVYIPIAGAILGILMSFVQFETRLQLEKERHGIKEVFELPKVYLKESLPQSLNEHQRHHANTSRANWYTP